MARKEIINSHIASLKEQAQIEKELKTGNEIYCEIGIEQYNQVLKDLAELDKFKNLMGTPVQDIMKRLKILEILKNIIAVIPNTKDTTGPKYYIVIRQDVILNDETKEIIKEWLANANNF